MTSYLLLRNNKESGPYTFEEIIQKGLKAYDLVWVNGKSAAWRYPGEIDELQAYSPVVEEQPYDRFFKKPQEEQHFQLTAARPEPARVREEPRPVPQSTIIAREEKPIVKEIQQPPVTPREEPKRIQEPEYIATQEQPVAKEYVQPPVVPHEQPRKVQQPEIIAEQEQQFMPSQPPVREEPVIKREEPVFSAKKSVFVTMPKQMQPVGNRIKEDTVNSNYQKYQPQDNIVPDPLPAKTITITENPVAAEIKYSQPLDEIKEMYVKTLQERKQRIANKAFLLQAVKKAAILLAIVGAGVLIGFTIKSNAVKKMVASAGSTQPNLIQQPASTPVTEEEQSEVTPDEIKTLEPADENTQQTPRQELTQVQREPTQQKKEKTNLSNDSEVSGTIIDPVAITQPKNEIVEPRQEPVNVDQPNPGVDVNSRTGERNRKVREGDEISSEPVTERVNIPVTKNDEPAPEPRKAAKENVPAGSISKLVSVKSNAYKIVAFGGIRDLQLTVLNDSRFLLDKVMVELQYLKPNEEPFRMDMIQFKSVSPGGAMTIRMPDTNRGIKVRYKIVQILSRQAARDADGL